MPDTQRMISDIILFICEAKTKKERLFLYDEFSPLIKNYKFVFASEDGGIPGYAFNKTFTAGGAIRSIFKTKNIWVLDPETREEMKTGSSSYKADYSIAFDTQALSYLVPYLSNKKGASIPLDFKEVFEFIAYNEVNIDPLPYYYENQKNLEDGIKVDKIYDNLKAYAVLKTLDIDWLKNRGEIRSTLQEAELLKDAQEQMSWLYMNLNTRAKDDLSLLHLQLYCLLLKMSLLQLKYPSSEASIYDKKMMEFMDFCHLELAFIPQRETVIAHTYFKQGQKLRFFKKIQKNKSNLKSILNNMAWDLFHIRLLEKRLMIKPIDSERYFFSALLTFDKDLIEIMDLCPATSCVFNINDNILLPFFKPTLQQLVQAEEDSNFSINNYFNHEAILSRETRMGNTINNINNIVEQLELEIISVSGK
ncbi:hypothetical protein RHO15_06990 [Utexia brackfieldae]|uniref:hypothetical protein n=1 Tax=Utexia brackfieldae TaxID=3074108 RepID=UPI00370D9A6E